MVCGVGRGTTAAVSFLLVLGCAGTAGPAASSASPSVAPAPAHGLRPALVATQLAVGTYRFPIGVSDRNTPVADAAVHVRVFSGAGGSATLKGEADAPYTGDGLAGHG